MLPYRGIGTGVPRALQAWPKIELIDDHEGNQFKAVVWRPYTGEVPGKVTPQVTPKVTPQVGTQPESQPESLENRVLRTLATKPASKAEISAQLGQKEVSG